MAAAPTRPHAYVKEVPSGVTTNAEASMSTANFTGFTARGAVAAPVLCTSRRDYVSALRDDVGAGDLTQASSGRVR